MKKLFLSLFLIGSLGLITTSCKSDDDNINSIDYDTIADVFEFTASFDNKYEILRNIPTTYASDQILIYRLASEINGKKVWHPLPKIYYLDIYNDGGFEDLEYQYDFSTQDIAIYVSGSYDLEETPEFLENQTFRVVIIPGRFVYRSAASSDTLVNLKDYEAVSKYYNIDESKVTILK